MSAHELKGRNNMAKLVKEESDTGRLHIESPLMGESLVSKEFLKRTEAVDYFRMHPTSTSSKSGDRVSSTADARRYSQSWTCSLRLKKSTKSF